jgi:hypothetical protein
MTVVHCCSTPVLEKYWSIHRLRYNVPFSHLLEYAAAGGVFKPLLRYKYLRMRSTVVVSIYFEQLFCCCCTCTVVVVLECSKQNKFRQDLNLCRILRIQPQPPTCVWKCAPPSEQGGET